MNVQTIATSATPASAGVTYRLRKPYLLFIGDAASSGHAKTAFGIRDWAPDDVLAQWRLPGCRTDLNLPEMNAATAAASGAASLVIGIAPAGGRIPAHWIDCLVASADAGLDIVAGLHSRLNDIPELVAAARRNGVALIDVREPPKGIAVATGNKRSGKRLLTVGSDCALGKKYTALSLARAMRQAGLDADFRATGQTGILIAGEGLPMDAVVVDFAAGAAEALSPDAAPDHWDVIEGQGSLIHPAYAGVTLALVHGSQPDALILCHEAGRTHINDQPGIRIPPLDELAEIYLRAARLTNPGVQLVGASLNTSRLDESAGERALDEAEDLLQVPSFDPLRTSPDAIISKLKAL